MTCCHFSSDGKLLASAGHDKKVGCSRISNVFSINNRITVLFRSMICDCRFYSLFYFIIHLRNCKL